MKSSEWGRYNKVLNGRKHVCHQDLLTGLLPRASEAQHSLNNGCHCKVWLDDMSAHTPVRLLAEAAPVQQDETLRARALRQICREVPCSSPEFHIHRLIGGTPLCTAR